ncbi:MAG: glutamate-5-semialdehyde dehydrogenase [Robiginitomaculum sp.]|nr:glutamate-5-semialdehyde dehydrogenase [Robiginitomaculum sp.]
MIANEMQKMGLLAKAASQQLRLASATQRSLAISLAAEKIDLNKDKIIAANQRDVKRAKQNQLSSAFIDRLLLDGQRITDIVDTLNNIATQPDPLGKELDSWSQPNGLQFRKVAVPLGVIGIIYESRPNVTADAAALCLRSGNAVILRGGSDALQTSLAIFDCLKYGIITAELPPASVQIITHNDRAAVGYLLGGLQGNLDLVIPRGGKSLVARVQQDARVPVLSHLEGICHVYVHQQADPQMAVKLVLNSKMRRVGICGAAECLLIDKDCAEDILPLIVDELIEAGCELRGDEKAQSIDNRIIAAKKSDWGKEFLAPIMAVRVVKGIEEATEYINKYGSGHTDSIVTENPDIATLFQSHVDSAIVLHNASTQFADGGEFGFGAEIGIATGKLHARGPVGATQLTSYNYQVSGSGQQRD